VLYEEIQMLLEHFLHFCLVRGEAG
jgi:hypothetical protein